MAFLGEIYGSPHDTKIGDIFIWRGKMWRRGRGIIYRARPNLRIRQKFYPKHRVPGESSRALTGVPSSRLRTPMRGVFVMGWHFVKRTDQRRKRA